VANETQNAYYTDKTPPLIKMTAFTTLDEVEVAKMRTFISLQDPRIQAGEVFFYAPNSMNREIEGDMWPTLRQKSAATPAYAGERREKYEQLNADGSSTSVAVTRRVLWLNPVVSPDAFQQVNISLI
jgi:hypothetical protein